MNLKLAKNAKVLVDCDCDDLYVDVGGKVIPVNNQLCYADKPIALANVKLSDFTLETQVHDDFTIRMHTCALPMLPIENGDYVEVEIHAAFNGRVYNIKEKLCAEQWGDYTTSLGKAYFDEEECGVDFTLLKNGYAADGDFVKDDMTHIKCFCINDDAGESFFADELTIKLTKLETKKISLDVLDLPKTISNRFVVEYDWDASDYTAHFAEIEEARANGMLPVLYRDGYEHQLVTREYSGIRFAAIRYTPNSVAGEKWSICSYIFLPDGSVEYEVLNLG